MLKAKVGIVLWRENLVVIFISLNKNRNLNKTLLRKALCKLLDYKNNFDAEINEFIEVLIRIIGLNTVTGGWDAL